MADASAMVCGVSAQFQPLAVTQWPRSCMTLTLAARWTGLAGLTPAQFNAAAIQSLANCSEVSGLRIVLSSDERNADILLAAERMSGSVLAYAFFPSGNCNEQLQTRFNSNVTWSHELFLDTLTHELGHCFGLPHTNDQRDIMFPSIISGRVLDGRYGPHYSIPQLVNRYGEFEGDVPPIPPDPPPPIPPPTEPPKMPWAEIIKLVLELFRECNQPAEMMRQRIRRPRIFDRLRLSRKLSAGLGRDVWVKHREQILADLDTAAAEATDEDLQWLLAEAAVMDNPTP